MRGRLCFQPAPTLGSSLGRRAPALVARTLGSTTVRRFGVPPTRNKACTPPTPGPGLPAVWPMALMVQALTAVDAKEAAACLATLKASAAGTGFMHESFHKNSAAIYTRPWFAWANSLFGETVVTLAQRFPGVL
jgi:hypothetical protein